jgi:hypothetical protein
MTLPQMSGDAASQRFWSLSRPPASIATAGEVRTESAKVLSMPGDLLGEFCGLPPHRRPLQDTLGEQRGQLALACHHGGSMGVQCRSIDVGAVN